MESISGERNALHEARNRTLETIETARADIERIDAERVERMADLARIDPATNPGMATIALREEVERLRLDLENRRRRVTDAERVVETLQGEARKRTLETIATERAEIQRMDADRVERLAELARIDPATDHGLTTSALRDEVERLRLDAEAKRVQIADAERVAATLQSRIDAFDAELNSLRQRYSVEIGHLLDAVFSHLAAQYMSAAPTLAELLLQLAAVQDVMMHFRSGNSNGFDRRGYLPVVAPGNTGSLRPLVDCSQGLGPHTEAHRKAIIDSLGAIGYRWRFEG